jgi:hypothetical protein
MRAIGLLPVSACGAYHAMGTASSVTLPVRTPAQPELRGTDPQLHRSCARRKRLDKVLPFHHLAV